MFLFDDVLLVYPIFYSESKIDVDKITLCLVWNVFEFYTLKLTDFSCALTSCILRVFRRSQNERVLTSA